ncbi:MAG TPA: phytanoyl-CoA dioxygenase family protein [Caulobacteraceae bacterium]|jgi:ectoine hydroxylase-related dioxygenase (phytanoyl-CoA dioxygenase family)|nr:phytanoyl-CoA dioxygenase family protein [Caulobacteraceae bacterium]
MPTLKHLPADADAKEIAAILDSDGALILDDVLTAAEVARVRGEIDPYIDATKDGRDSFTGFQTTRTGALVARSEACRELVMHPAILAGCDAFLKRACDRYQLHLTQVIRIKPGQGKQPLHRDRLAWGGFLPPSIEPQFNTIWAMTDFTEANGATQIVPGSPTWPESRKADHAEVGYAEMKAGSVLIYSGSVIHAGGENRTEDQDRIGINITYCLGWLRQEENQYLSCPPAIARTLDPALQALLGYSMGSYALGYFTPPLPPGEGPEVVPPQFALGDKIKPSWGDDLYAEVTQRVRKQLEEGAGA